MLREPRLVVRVRFARQSFERRRGWIEERLLELADIIAVAMMPLTQLKPFTKMVSGQDVVPVGPNST